MWFLNTRQYIQHIPKINLIIYKMEWEKWKIDNKKILKLIIHTNLFSENNNRKHTTWKLLRKVEKLYINLTRFKNLFVSKTKIKIQNKYKILKTNIYYNMYKYYWIFELPNIDKNFRINYQNKYANIRTDFLRFIFIFWFTSRF